MTPDSHPALAGRLRDLVARLDATPAELLGLVVLAAGGAALAAVLWWQATPRAVAPDDTGPEPAGRVEVAPRELTVHVAGAVLQPGVVTLPGGARVSDALAAAGGPTVDADLDALNLARTLGDGEQVRVPRLGDEPSGGGAGGGGRGGARGPDGRLDLNRATAEQLEELPGIGPVLAGRILRWRESQGRFDEVGQLREVPGIGERTFQSLVELVAV